MELSKLKMTYFQLVKGTRVRLIVYSTHHFLFLQTTEVGKLGKVGGFPAKTSPRARVFF